jgi:hypothetical protein
MAVRRLSNLQNSLKQANVAALSLRRRESGLRANKKAFISGV